MLHSAPPRRAPPVPPATRNDETPSGAPAPRTPPRTPEGPLDIHLIAVGGTGMAPLACLLQELGHRVRGSDGPLYPPMSDLLAAHGIEPAVGYHAGNLVPRPDLVIVGNAVPRDNPEAREAERLGLPRLSMPQALARFCLAGRRPLVIAGTHGKTTTTSLAAWVWTACGRDPGYLVGGVPRDLPSSFRLGGGDRFVVEGDEYNAAYFDRGPKFLHYRASTAILTSAEYDHADLYESPAALLDAYRELVAGLPDDGLLVACGDTAEVRRLAAAAPCRTVLYGLGAENDLRPLAPPQEDERGLRFAVADEAAGEVELELALSGDHGVANALAVWAAARADGLQAAEVAAAMGRFRGTRRRMEEVGEVDGVLVMDDFAHHPTAVETTLAGLARRYPGRRRVVLFEPRSLTAGRRLFQQAWEEAFAVAHRVLLAPVFHAGRLPAEERLDLDALVRGLASRGVEGSHHHDLDALAAAALAEARPGDLLVTMSSGAFGGMARRLVAALAARDVSASAMESEGSSVRSRRQEEE